MSVLSVPAPAGGNFSSQRRFSVDEYHQMIDAGILDENDNVELLEGYVVLKMPRNPSHDRVIQRITRRLIPLLPAGWDLRGQCAVTLQQSEPEPDFVIVRGDDSVYETRHPGPADIGLLIEVANTTLAGDRAEKGWIYAREGIPTYWIVNLADRQIEVYTQPSGLTAVPAYGQRQDFKAGTSLTLSLDGTAVATIPVVDLLP